MVSKTGPSCPWGRLLLVALPFLLILAWCLRDSQAFVQTTTEAGGGLFWSDSEVTLNLRVGCPPNNPLTAWGPCWDDAAEDAARRWNAAGARFTFHIQSPSRLADPCGRQDGLTTVVWADTQCGEAFGDGTLAVTKNLFYPTGKIVDSDYFLIATSCGTRIRGHSNSTGMVPQYTISMGLPYTNSAMFWASATRTIMVSPSRPS